MTETSMIRVLIADDFKLLRDVIRLYLGHAEDINVVDEAPDLNDALERATTLRPDVIIMNDYLPPTDSAHATARFRDQGLTAAILVISMHLEPNLIQRSFLSGVNGFMHKDEIDDYVVEAIRRVHQGERYLSPKARDAYSNIQE
ncbi:MAG TPA: response regulator transcription factor [Anaerolineales bacterium]|nr:response regulator transcription factor [Anaerolineales bacterium]